MILCIFPRELSVQVTTIVFADKTVALRPIGGSIGVTGS